MTRVAAAMPAPALSACHTDTVHLRNPTTGQTVQCGPYFADLRGCCNHHRP